MQTRTDRLIGPSAGLGRARNPLRLLLAVTMGVLVASLYVSSLDNPFMMDDHPLIVNNPLVMRPGLLLYEWRQELTSPSPPRQVLAQPVTQFSYSLNLAVSGMSPLAFRLANIGLLALVGCLAAVWLNQYCVHPAGPWLAAFLFAAHPANAELINHIIGRSELLAMAGVLVFLILQRSVLDRLDRIDRLKRWLTLKRLILFASIGLTALAAAAVAMFSSRTGLLVIPMAIAQVGAVPIWRRRLSIKRQTTVKSRQWIVHLAFVLCLLLPAVGLRLDRQLLTDPLPIGTPDTDLGDLTMNPAIDADLTQRLPMALSLAGQYLKQVFVPTIQYSHIPINLPNWGSEPTWLGAIVLLIVVAGLISSILVRHWLRLVPILILSHWVLTSNIWLRSHVYASTMYVMPLVLAAVVPVAWLIDRTTRERGSFNRATHDVTRLRAVAVVPCLLVVCVMALRVLQINGIWFSKQRLMAANNSLQANNSVATYLYGASLMEVQAYNHARDWLELTLEYRPESLQALNKLATLEEISFRPKVASDLYERILLINPDDVRAYIRLAHLAIQQEEFTTAYKYLDQALKMRPVEGEALYLYAHLADVQGDHELALSRFRRLLEEHPNYRQGQRELARLEGRDVDDPPPRSPGSPG